MSTAENAGAGAPTRPDEHREILFNAFDMNCVAHQSPGLWRHPDDHARDYNTLGYWTHLAQTLEKGLGRLVGGRRELRQRPGAEDVEAPTIGARATGIEQHCARRVADGGEEGGRVGAVTEAMEGTGRHEEGSDGHGRRL